MKLARVEPTEKQRDDAAVERFAAAMKRKMTRCRFGGRNGWWNESRVSTRTLAMALADELTTDSGRPDPVDIANYAMMLYHRGVEGRRALRQVRAELLEALGDEGP